MFIKKMAEARNISETVFLRICISEKNVTEILKEAGCNITALKKNIQEDIKAEDEAFSRIPAPSGHYITQNAQKIFDAFARSAQRAGLREDEVSELDFFGFMLGYDEHEEIEALSWIEESGGSLEKAKEILESKFPVGHGRKVPSPCSSTSAQNECLPSFLTDMMEEAKSCSLPFIGREDVLERTIQVLNRKTKHNVFHLGEPGVGKTACTIGLARRIIDGSVPNSIKEAKVYSLDIGSLMAGTKYRGELEEKLTGTLKYLSSLEHSVILYIDEVHMAMKTGAGGESACDIGNLLKPYLSNPDSRLRVIGSTTLEEYRQKIEPDKAFCRRFQTIKVEEPTQAEAIKMLQGMKKAFETYHNVSYTKEAIEASVSLSAKYITDRFLPDKAIDLIDEAGSKASIAGVKLIDKKHIQETIAKIARIPDENVSETDTDKLRKLKSELEGNVYGQDEAIAAITKAILLNKAGLTEDNKPVANLLFVGPTGVGKTEVAKTVAKVMGIPFIRYDMSEYKDQTSVNKLIGASSGYVGYEDGGRLINDIKNNPHCVLLLDEIEKAHPAVFDIFLQVFDNAALTDNKGRVADFRNVIIMMTSNAGAADIQKRELGFNKSSINVSAMDSAVKSTFSPEFRNRLTAIVKFNSMDKVMAEAIARKQLGILADKLSAKAIKLKWDDKTVTAIVERSKAMEMGGREIQRTIENEIKPLLTEEILFGSLQNGGSATLSVDNAAFKLSVRKRRSAV